VYRGKRIGVVVPAFNEDLLVGKTLTTMPDFVDRIVAIDDGSSDATFDRIRSAAAQDSRIEGVQHPENQGLGATLVDGYGRLLEGEDAVDIVAVMAGDAQMDPDQLHLLLDEIVANAYDAAKGNRFLGHEKELRQMPKHRLFGNIIMTLLTKLASGYWSIFDTQNGYYAISSDVLRRIDLSRISKGYEVENSFLIEANIIGARLKDVPMPAVYGEETSTLRLGRFIPRVLRLMTSGFFRRVWNRYVIANFHPVAVFLYFGLFLVTWGLGFGLWALVQTIGPDVATTGTVMLSVAPFLMGFQLLLAAIILDILSEPK
jgi:glycosyltransferase involved in cell wall biosynthesis